MTVLALVVAPLVLVMIFKSERKQAKFQHWYTQANKNLVKIQFDKAEDANNFKLVSGQGTISC